MNNRGQYLGSEQPTPSYMGIFTLALLIIVGMVIIFFIAFVGPNIASMMGTLKTSVDTMPADNSEYNVTGKLQTIAGPVFAIGNMLEWVSYAAIIGILILTIAMAAGVRTYPILVLPYILVMGAVIIMAIFLSSGYESIAAGNVLYSDWEGTDFMVKNLPWIMTAIAFIGGALMFVLINTRPEVGV